MNEPCQCLGIVAEAQSGVNGFYGCIDPVPEFTEQAPAAAFLGELLFSQDLLTWDWVREVGESLCALPKDRADELLDSWKRAVERTSTRGNGQ